MPGRHLVSKLMSLLVEQPFDYGNGRSMITTTHTGQQRHYKPVHITGSGIA